MQVRLATYADREAWDDYVLNHSDGTAYQFFPWKDAIEKAYALKSLYLLAENSSGICGIFPLIDFRIPIIGRTFISLPYCDAGGILADNQNIEHVLIDHACLMAQEMRAGIKIRSIRPLLPCGKNRTDKVSMILDLPNSSETMLASYKSSLRSQIKKPLRDGLSVLVGKKELLDDFYSVFTENMRDLGSPVHARLWLEAVTSEYEDRVRVAVVYTPDKVPAAAGIVLLHPSRVSIPWASSLRRYNGINPNMLLYWTFLAFAADNGYRQFDFGRSTPGEGTYRFKQQWGAKPQQLYWYEKDASRSVGWHQLSIEPSHIDKQSSKRQLAVSLWQMLPQFGTDWLGPKIRKYISL
ncbi:MAG: hypothetical protein DRH08_05240 [Deltaproteobacteria bacterium]|nr:MAG: hypothetical protein DRH08_05240 [Deltaproteobacteria bacterium]